MAQVELWSNLAYTIHGASISLRLGFISESIFDLGSQISYMMCQPESKKSMTRKYHSMIMVREEIKSTQG